MAPPGLRVRRARQADAEAVREVGLNTWPSTYGPSAGDAYVAYGLEKWWSIEATRRAIAQSQVFVAELDHQVVGVVSLGTRDETPVIWRMYVLPDHQKEGVGSALMDAVLGALPRGATRLVLEYVAGNEPAAAFYRRYGFRELRRDPDPEGWPDAVWMVRDLPAAPERDARSTPAPR